MTTATSLEPKPLKQYYTLPIDRVFPNPDNPRRITDDHPSLPGLAETIKSSVGLIEPIVVRSLSEGSGWIILAGERRWRASRLACLPTIDAKVVDVDEQQAYYITVVENLQREDLHWTEEANGVESMTARGWDVATIAGHIGKSEAWVRLRAKLVGLSPKWRAAVADPKDEFHGWPVSKLELIARFPIAVQDEMALDWEVRETQTAGELQARINEHYLRKLAAAPWDQGDALLYPKAGACSVCPKRSSCQKTLFEDATGDRCTDGACWDKKAEAYLAREKKALQKLHPGLKTLSTDYNTKADLRDHDVKICKEGAKGAVPLLVVSGQQKGQLVYGQKLNAYNDSASGGSRSVSKAPVKGEKVSVKERLAALEKRRGRHVCELFVKWFKSIRSIPANLEDAGLLVLAATAGTSSRISQYDAKEINAAIGKAQERKLMLGGADMLWAQVRQTLVEAIEHATKYGEPPMTAVAALCLLDPGWAAKRNEWIPAAQKALPIPKALAADIEAEKSAKASKPKPSKPAKAARAKS